MMKNRSEPWQSERTCVCCRKKAGKDALLRIVRSKNGEIRLDPKQRLEGRGAYVCREGDCFSLLQKKRGLERAFRCKIPPEAYERLTEESD